MPESPSAAEGGIATVVDLLRKQMGWAGWALAITATTATNLTDFAAAPAPGTAPSADFIVAGLLRVAVVFWAAYGLTRLLGGIAEPLSFTRHFWPFAGASVLFLAPTGLAIRGAFALAGRNATPEVHATLITLLTMALAALLIRPGAWKAGLAFGDLRSLPRIWAPLRGKTMPLVVALVVLGALPQWLHSWLTLTAMRSPQTERVWIAAVDGVVSGILLAILTAVTVAAWRQSNDAG